MREHARDGRDEAIETLHRFIGELMNRKQHAGIRPRKPPRKVAVKASVSV